MSLVDERGALVPAPTSTPKSRYNEWSEQFAMAMASATIPTASHLIADGKTEKQQQQQLSLPLSLSSAIKCDAWFRPTALTLEIEAATQANDFHLLVQLLTKKPHPSSYNYRQHRGNSSSDSDSNSSSSGSDDDETASRNMQIDARCQSRALCVATVNKYRRILYFLLDGRDIGSDTASPRRASDKAKRTGKVSPKTRQVSREDLLTVTTICADYGYFDLFSDVVRTHSTLKKPTNLDILAEDCLYYAYYSNHTDIVLFILGLLNQINKVNLGSKPSAISTTSGVVGWDYWRRIILSCTRDSLAASVHYYQSQPHHKIRRREPRASISTSATSGSTGRSTVDLSKQQMLSSVIRAMQPEWVNDPWLISLLATSGHIDFFKIFFERGFTADYFLNPGPMSSLNGILPSKTTLQSGLLDYEAVLPTLPTIFSVPTIAKPRFDVRDTKDAKGATKQWPPPMPIESGISAMSTRPMRVLQLAERTAPVCESDVEHNLACRKQLRDLYQSFVLYNSSIPLPPSIEAKLVSKGLRLGVTNCGVMKTCLQNCRGYKLMVHQLASTTNLFYCLLWNVPQDRARLVELWNAGLDFTRQQGYSDYLLHLTIESTNQRAQNLVKQLNIVAPINVQGDIVAYQLPVLPPSLPQLSNPSTSFDGSRIVLVWRGLDANCPMNKNLFKLWIYSNFFVGLVVVENFVRKGNFTNFCAALIIFFGWVEEVSESPKVRNNWRDWGIFIK